MASIAGRERCIPALLICFGLLLGIVPEARGAKKYWIQGVNIQAQLHPDGTMEVVESRTYRFSGPFRFAFRTMPKRGSVVFLDFRVSENGRYFEESQAEAPGTFRIIRRPGHDEIRWFFSAEDQSRTFDFHYRVLKAVQKHEDAAVLYYQFISADWDREQAQVRLQLRPPEPSPAVQEWLHGPLWAESRIEPDGTVTAWCELLPRRTFFEIRALYPPEAFPEVGMKSGRVRQKIMEEEARWAEEANLERARLSRELARKEKIRTLGPWVSSVLGLAGLLLAWTFYRKYGRRPELPPAMTINSEIPEKTPPALVSYLLNSREVTGGALVATFLDLARRGFLSLREERVQKKRFLGGTKTATEYYWERKPEISKEEASRLGPFEDSLLRFIFEDLAEGAGSISFREIRKHRSRFTMFFRQWTKQVKALAAERSWFDRKSFRAMFYSLGLEAVMIGLTVICAVFFGAWAVVLGACAVAVLVLAFLTPHRTAEGEKLSRGWKALKRYLQKYHFRDAETSSLLTQINDYFVYGVVLGLDKKVFKELAGFVPSEEYRGYLPWYIYHGREGAAFSPDAFAAAFSTMVATATSSMSTAAGTGGGASAGGGGGAGSGGGGAG